VAGLIAAKHNNGNIVGLVPNTRLVPFPTITQQWNTADAITVAANSEAKIVNLSLQWATQNLPTGLDSAICTAH
jgi:hypothetical protein